MKAIRSDIKVSPHGGVVPILKKIKEFGIPQVIRACLGKRKEQSKYGYEDVFIAWVLTALCGGTRLKHISNLDKKLNIIPGLKIPSHDTLGRVMKHLATEVQTKETVKGYGENLSIHKNKYCENEALNNMLIIATKRSGALKENTPYTLHIDATFIETNCATATLGKEKKMHGFYPMICLIDNMPVYISMRNGDSNASFEIKECLEKCLDILAKNKIMVKKVISDTAGYRKSITDMLHERGIKFNIHMPVNHTFKSMFNDIDNCDNWRNIELKTANYVRECEIGEINYQMHDSMNINRLIIVREYDKITKRKYESMDEKERRLYIDEKMKRLKSKNLLKGDAKTYKEGEWKKYKEYKIKIIITNDYKKTPEELVIEYNKRGDAERKFDFMKNDFGWKYPPFMKMNENAVFMFAAALANNIFRGMVSLFKKRIPQLRLNARLREFQYIFIDVACAYINKTYVFYNTDIEYELLI